MMQVLSTRRAGLPPTAAWRRGLGRASALTARFAELSSILSLILMTVLVSVQVVLRYAFGRALPWAEEAAIYLMMWVAFVGSAVALRHAEHISLGLIGEKFTGWASSGLRVVVNLTLLAFVILIAILGCQLAILIGGQRSPSLGIDMFWPYMILPVGCFAMGIELFDRLFRMLLPSEVRGED